MLINFCRNDKGENRERLELEIAIMEVGTDAPLSTVVFAVIIIIALSLVVLLMILYYINRKWFNNILKDLAGKIDPDGETPHIDELPKLYKKEKLEFKKVYRTPLPPRIFTPQRAQYDTRRSETKAATTKSRPTCIFDMD